MSLIANMRFVHSDWLRPCSASTACGATLVWITSLWAVLPYQSCSVILLSSKGCKPGLPVVGAPSPGDRDGWATAGYTTFSAIPSEPVKLSSFNVRPC